MIIGCPREVKNNEFRVALTPAGALELAKRGHTVRVEAGAGTPSGFSDEQYAETGATIVETAAEAWDADLVVKVKEPQPREFGFIDTQILFCYLHLAAEPEVTRALLDTSVTAYAYENVTGTRGFPLLAPMSEVAGRLATQVGAYHLMGPLGGSGILMGGVPGTAPAKVAIIGGGVAGESAARMAAGLGAEVRLLDVNLDRLRDISAQYGTAVQTLASNELTIAETVADADLVIGSVLIPGAAAPKLVTSEMVSTMRDGSVLVDIAIDQGGCFEGSHPTTHDDPTFEVDGKIYYCVANMPGAVPRTSTVALTNATLPVLMQLADGDPDEHLTAGLNVRDGRIVHETVARHYES